MKLLLWLIICFIVGGFIVLVSMKKGMERKLALIKKNEVSMEEEQISSRPIILWILGSVLWGIVSMRLIVWSFSVYT